MSNCYGSRIYQRKKERQADHRQNTKKMWIRSVFCNVTMPVDTRTTSLDEGKDVRSQEGKIVVLYGRYNQVYIVSKNLEG